MYFNLKLYNESTYFINKTKNHKRNRHLTNQTWPVSRLDRPRGENPYAS